MTHVDSDDRHGFPRAPMTMLLKLLVHDGNGAPSNNGGRSVPGITMDMCRDGCSVWLSEPLHEGVRCEARFYNTDGRIEPEAVSVVVERVLRQADGYLVGLEFERPLERLAARRDATDHGPRPVRALIVDDQAQVRDVLSRFLARRGFEVEVASDGEEALQKIRQRAPQVLLLDLVMPRMNGHEVLRRIRQEGLSVGVTLTISGHADANTAGESLRLGAVEHVGKPLNFHELDWSIRLNLGAIGR